MAESSSQRRARLLSEKLNLPTLDVRQWAKDIPSKTEARDALRRVSRLTDRQILVKSSDGPKLITITRIISEWDEDGRRMVKVSQQSFGIVSVKTYERI